MKLAAIAVSAALVGCANVQPPVDVSLIPNDCANQQKIIAWLESQSRVPPAKSNNLQQYEQYHASIRARIWHLRYNCNPV
jgi:hypothetical protein